MRKISWMKISICVVALLCNAGFLCWLIVEVFRNPPTISEIAVPTLIGLFFVLNIAAITLTFRGTYKTAIASTSPARGFSIAHWIVSAIVILVCIGLGFWAGFRSYERIIRWRWERAQQAKIERFVGKKAPAVATRTLNDTEWRLEDQQGKVVIMDFWATWCGPCIGALPEMKKLYEKYKSREDFVMVGVSLDTEKEKLMKFCEENEIGWPQIFEADKGWDNSVGRAFKVNAIPSVWVIGKEGIVAGVDLRNNEEIERTVEKSLNTGQKTEDAF
jgi:thiol-disulfide isomerase/thioredoxin